METACEAIKSGRCLEVRYDGFHRVVEVHAVGYTRLNEAMMLVWQVRGSGASGKASVGWRWLKLREIRGVVIAEESSRAPREGYLANDETLSRIVCQV